MKNSDEHKRKEEKIDLTEISEIKEILEFWTKRFDEDTKLFHTETMNLKKENKKQLELIIRLISTQSKQIDSKIKFFEIFCINPSTIKICHSFFRFCDRYKIQTNIFKGK